MSETDCTKFLAEIELFLDRELDASQSAELEAHLNACGGCMDRAEFRRTLKVLIARKCRCEDVPDTLVTRVMERLEAEPPVE